MVDLEWDRSHETITAIVRAETPEGVIVSEIVDLSAVPGFRWIRANEIVSVEDVAPDAPVSRLADRRGDRSHGLEPRLTELRELLRLLEDSVVPVAIYTERTGSKELLVGTEVVVDHDRLVVNEVDTDGSVTGDQLEFDLGEIVCIDWGTRYLRDLQELGEQQ